MKTLQTLKELRAQEAAKQAEAKTPTARELIKERKLAPKRPLPKKVLEARQEKQAKLSEALDKLSKTKLTYEQFKLVHNLKKAANAKKEVKPTLEARKEAMRKRVMEAKKKDGRCK